MKVIFLAILLTGSLCLAQSDRINAYKFYQQISEASHQKSNVSYKKDIDSLYKVIFGQGKAQMKMDTLSNWELLYEYTVDWSHVVFSKPLSIVGYNKCSAKVYHGAMLFRGFGMNDALLDKGDTLLAFPRVYERNDPLNGLCTPVLSGDFLVIRLVLSYPYGNQTSWYQEFCLYFKKVIR